MQNTRRIQTLFQRNIEFIINLTTNHQATLNWMREQELLPNIRRCCGGTCGIYRNTRSIDGEMFRCGTCRRKYNIRGGTLWEDFRRIPLVLLVRLVFHHFVNGNSAKRAHVSLAEAGLHIGYVTLKRVYKRVRSGIESYMFNEVYRNLMRGRIQIDEALFTHRSGPGRRGFRQVWVVGMLEERSSEAYCFVVRNRNHASINQIIRTHVLPGAYIIHDGWGGYRRIPREYQHHRYTHDPNDRDNTSRIEGVWGELRAFIRNIYSAGVVEGNVNSIIQELVFRRRCRELNLGLRDALVEALVRN